MFKGDFKLTKVPGKQNLVDSLTKYVGAEEIRYHMLHTSQVNMHGRHIEAPKVNMDEWDDGIEEYSKHMGSTGAYVCNFTFYCSRLFRHGCGKHMY